MAETAPVAQPQKPEKPRSAKILQWVELFFAATIFFVTLYVNDFLEFQPNDPFFYLSLLLTAPFLLFSSSFFTQNKKLLKLSIVTAYLLLAISILVTIYLSVIIFPGLLSYSWEGNSNAGLGGLAFALVAALLLVTLIGSLIILPMLIVTLIFLRKNLKSLKEVSY